MYISCRHAELVSASPVVHFIIFYQKIPAFAGMTAKEFSVNLK